MSPVQTTAAGSRHRRESGPKVTPAKMRSATPSGVISVIRARLLDKIYTYGPKVFAFGYGLVCFSALAVRAVIEGSIIKRPGPRFWNELESERTRQWDLSSPPYYGLKHAFFTLTSGAKLHYLTSNLEYVNQGSENGKQTAISRRSNLVIFLHGWPDTCMLWNDVISRLPLPVRDDTTLVAVDLPGFGGSDGLRNYGPDEVISALFDFIIGMRSLYLENVEDNGNQSTFKGLENGKILIVGHDWGALCGFKLAALAPQLADRFILCNSVLPELALQNCKRRWETACKLYREWKSNFPAKLLPKKALTPLRPVLRQIGLSVYVFIFNLPMILARASMSNCNLWALRLISSIANGHRGITHTSRVAAHMAGFMGPNEQICDTMTPDGQHYGPTVFKRAAESISVETLRFYRDGLASNPWIRQNKHALLLHQLDSYNHDVRKKRLVGTLKTAPLGRLNVPATIIWGERDPALDATLTMEDMDEYLTEESQVIRLAKVGHWTPLEGEGPAVVATMLDWALGEQPAATIAQRVQSVCANAKMSLML